MDITIKISQYELDSLNPEESRAVVSMISSVHELPTPDTFIWSTAQMFSAQELGAVTVKGTVPLERIWALFDRLRPKIYDGPTVVMGVDIS